MLQVTDVTTHALIFSSMSHDSKHMDYEKGSLKKQLLQQEKYLHMIITLFLKNLRMVFRSHFSLKKV